ncbi:hypothetical protein ACFL27_27170 [candidate division CSSED10-310 bacterium]|uniref:HMA domain-containing protein n=1 Tax=candidate division CSSED10-310 bacterium TaxID=2855610 RepID=A0ABV6Z619_UNCC1
MDTNKDFQVIFKGELAPGRELTDVKASLQKILRIDRTRVDRLFSGKGVILRKELDETSAKKFKKHFEQSGALCHVVEKKPKPSPAPAFEPEPQQPEPKKMVCPQCGLEQALGSECIGCGIIVQKFRQRKTAEQEAHSGEGKPQKTDQESTPPDLKQLPSLEKLEKRFDTMWQQAAKKSGFEEQNKRQTFVFGGVLAISLLLLILLFWKIGFGFTLGSIFASLLISFVVAGIIVALFIRTQPLASLQAQTAEYFAQEMPRFFDKQADRVVALASFITG